MGVWIVSGSRDEPAALNGISHFVEHMVFKGTTSRSAQQFAREVDSIGGNLDAFTGKENICFNIKVLDENVAPALDLLADLVLHPTFTPEDIAREQGVILEEIKMDEDSPDYLVHETFTQNFWKGDALGRPILGTVQTVSSFTQQIVFDFYAGRFTPRNMVFSAAGHLDHDHFVAQVADHFSSLTATTGSPLARPPAPATHAHITLKRKKSLEQVQLCLGVPAPAVDSRDRYAVYLLNTMLGGGMSSRLFQAIREEKGLAYSIYSETSPFRDTGALSIYAGASIDKTAEVLRLTIEELRRLKEEPVPEAELKRAKDQHVQPGPSGDVLRPLLLGRRDHRGGRSHRRLNRAIAGATTLPPRSHRPHHARQPRHPQSRPRRPSLLTQPIFGKAQCLPRCQFLHQPFHPWKSVLWASQSSELRLPSPSPS
jgi:predicted Zn-dependent peptidase